MADLKISAATPNPAPVGTDSFATNKAGVDFQTTLTQILSLVTLPESPQGLGVWKYRTETGEPPASGQIRFDNANISLATELYIAETNSGGPTDVSLFLDILLVPGAILYIQDKTVSANNVLVECGAVTDEGTYRKVIIANILENGTEPSNNTDIILVIGIAPSGVVEVNDLTSIVTWDDIPDANVPESAVTQHEAALTIIESQITGAAFGNWNTAFGWGNHALAGYLTSFTETNDLTAAVVWANIPDANVPASAVTQHVAAIDHDALLNFLASEHFTQAAISIPASQISDFDVEVANNADVAANSAKVSNATHTDEVTGSGALAAAPPIISNKAVVTAVATDKVLLLDATDGLLKAADVSDFLVAASEVNDLSVIVTWADIPDANVPESAVTQHVAALDHDQLLNFLTSEHFTQAAISIPASQISDFDTEVGNNAAVAANTAKVTNATHTGQVTGATALALAVSAITAQPASGVLVGADTMIVNDGGVLSEATMDQLATFIGGGGDVFKVDTPLIDQIGVWTGDGTIKGFAGFEFDGSQLLLPDGAAGTPSLAFNSGGEGFWTGGVAQLNASIGGVRKMFLNSSAFTVDGSIGVESATGPRMLLEVPSATNPVINVRQFDANTGLGSVANGSMSQISDGEESTRTVAASAGGLQANNQDTGGGLERVLTESDLGGGGLANDAVQARRTTSFTIIASFVDVTLDATDVETDDAVIEHDAVTDRIVVKETGTYKIAYELDIDNQLTTGSDLVVVQGRVRLNDAGTGINGSITNQSAFRDTSVGDGANEGRMNPHLSNEFIANLSASDFITLQLNQIPDTGGLEIFTAENVTLQVTRLL
jgi:hypothetical protein